MTIDLYHGSNQIIQIPSPTGGRLHNDYGQGFYCTRHIELAKEWAVSENTDGFVNHYLLCLDNLKVLNLNDTNYSILHWLTLLLTHRILNLSSAIAREGFQYLTSHYFIETDTYDLIIGYRADDSYFSFARAFLSNTITLEQLKQCMYLGELGEQYFFQSKLSFSNLAFKDYSYVAKDEYYPKRIARDKNARLDFQKIQGEDTTGTYLIDLIRKEK